MRLLLILLFLITFGTNSVAATRDVPAPLFDNLGSYHRPIDTSSPLAQRYFDQGMTLFYGFEWGEAIRSFKAATIVDPKCAMCYFGFALALTYKSNEPISGNEMKQAKAAIETAKQRVKGQQQGVNGALIDALFFKYQSANRNIMHSSVPGCHHGSAEGADPHTFAFIKRLEAVSKKYPQDIDAKVIYATALFWYMVSLPTPDDTIVRKLQNTLQPIVASGSKHVGAHHYFIHSIEGSEHPERALVSAELFKTLVPGSQHLVHMPSHIYFLIGDYHTATEANLRAIETYKNYMKRVKAQGFKPILTYLYHHDYDFLRSSATMEGRKKLAYNTAQELVALTSKQAIEADPNLQWFLPIPNFVALRFGMWEEVLKTEKPNPDFQYASGMWYYAQGIALTRTGHIADAENALQHLTKITVAGERHETLDKLSFTLLKIAENMLHATIENAMGNETATIAYLKKADHLQQTLKYHEPPDWYFNVKEALGAAYLRWHHPTQAEQMFTAVLKAYPKSPWALYGLAQSLEAQDKKAAASKVYKEYKIAWEYADIPAPVPIISY